MIYPPAPTTFEDLMKLIPACGSIAWCRFVFNERPFELHIGRNSSNILWIEFCVPQPPWQFWPCIRTVESITRQRIFWGYWQQFLAEPEMYLTWNYIGKPIDYPKLQ